MNEFMAKVHEETNTKNITACIAHANQTRKLVRELKEEVAGYKATVVEYEKKLEQLQTQITNLQKKLYQGGSNGD